MLRLEAIEDGEEQGQGEQSTGKEAKGRGWGEEDSPDVHRADRAESAPSLPHKRLDAQDDKVGMPLSKCLKAGFTLEGRLTWFS
jgi:hypothetical protein